MPRGKAHGDETRAAVMAALMTGQSVGEVAGSLSLPIQTVDRWAKSAELGVVGSKKGISELVQDLMTEYLIGLRAQIKHASTENYVAKQPASDLAVLHGVMADKAFRLLAAAASAAGNGATASIVTRPEDEPAS